MRLIDADKLQERAYQMRFGTRITEGGLALINYLLSEEPTVDPVKHGRWDLIDACEPVRYGCSVCHRMVWHYENYCPNCGARMDEEEE